MTRLQTAIIFAAIATSPIVARPLPASAQSVRYGLRGTILTPDTKIDDGLVVVKDRLIESVGPYGGSDPSLQVVDVGGIIVPGLVDLHNHTTWNSQPRWKPNKPVRDRYEWLAMPEYKQNVEKPQYAIRDTNACDQQRYGEIKALIGGATSTTGNLADPKVNVCEIGLVRDLDYASELYGSQANQEPLKYDPFPLEMNPEKEKALREGLDKGEIKSVVFHVGEGVDASAEREFKMLSSQKLVRKEIVVVHGTAATPDDFAMLATNKAGLVWSPRSNIELYGQTTNIAAAKEKGVPIAIAPDWSLSGSNGMLDELDYAWKWSAAHGKPLSAEELLQAATIVPATLAGAADLIGSIGPNKLADLLVVDAQPGKSPYESVVTTKPAGVRLVIVGGRPMFGRKDLLTQIMPKATLEDVSICNQTRGLDLSSADNGKGSTLKATASALESELKKYQLTLAPLVDC